MTGRSDPRAAVSAASSRRAGTRCRDCGDRSRKRCCRTRPVSTDSASLCTAPRTGERAIMRLVRDRSGSAAMKLLGCQSNGLQVQFYAGGQWEASGDVVTRSTSGFRATGRASGPLPLPPARWGVSADYHSPPCGVTASCGECRFDVESFWDKGISPAVRPAERGAGSGLRRVPRPVASASWCRNRCVGVNVLSAKTDRPSPPISVVCVMATAT